MRMPNCNTSWGWRMRWRVLARSISRFSSPGSRVQRPTKSTTLSPRSAERERPHGGRSTTSRKKRRRKRTGVSRLVWLLWRSTSNMTASPPTCAVSTIDPTRSSATIFIDDFSSWHGDVAKLAISCQPQSDAALRSGLCLAVGSIALGQVTEAERAAWTPVLTQWYETASDGATHSAAGWALRQWRFEAPAPAATSQPSEGRQWLVNSLGMTLLEINPGVFVRKDQTEARDQRVQLTRAFFLGDREISVGQFQQFISDASCPNQEKPEKWQGADAQIGPTPYHPVQQVNWYDAVLFCNWLSRKEGRTPCYERTGKKEKSGDVEHDAWQLVADATGYRLPTEAEWEYACRAGTTTEFASGRDEEMLRKYAVIQANRPAPCGSKLPNGWGLFDVQGNVWEWCWDGLGKFDAKSPAVDPTGAAGVPIRVIRGGGWFSFAEYAWASYRGRSAPEMRLTDLGFRVARGQSRGKR